MKSSMVVCAQRKPVDAGAGLCVHSLPGCLGEAIRESTRLIRDMAFYGFCCCQRERALNSSRCFKIKQKGAIMQPNQGKAAAYKAELSP